MKKINILIVIVLACLVFWSSFTKKSVRPTENTTEKITYNNTSTQYINVNLPTPGAVTGKEFRVMGEARGFFFEGSFPVEILDKNGKQLFIGPAHAGSDWMVDALVPFSIDVKIGENYIGPATVVLHKDNPSLMPEHDASISFPITIEY